jgi:serine/threonine-protein kinase RsbW
MGLAGISKRITLPADLENLPILMEFILEYADQKGFKGRECREIELAADEILTNIISYAYPERKGYITVVCEVEEKDVFCAQVMDSGIPFNPLEVKVPDISSPLEEREIGGLGLFLAGRMVDDIQYRRENGKNILTITKKKAPES